MKSSRATSTKTARPATTDRDAHDLPTATALKLWVVLSRAQWAVTQVSIADIERNGLSPAEFAILEVLFHKGPLLLGEVQKKVLVSSGGITFLVDKLAKRDLVERRDCPSDRRARYAALTKAGEKLMREIFPGHAAVIRESMAGLTVAEQKTLTSLLKTLGKEAERVAAGTPQCKKAMAEMAADGAN
jgi:MarR family 2-MHQ and catechol resistance regulon transcriptional repressor